MKSRIMLIMAFGVCFAPAVSAGTGEKTLGEQKFHQTASIAIHCNFANNKQGDKQVGKTREQNDSKAAGIAQ